MGYSACSHFFFELPDKSDILKVIKIAKLFFISYSRSKLIDMLITHSMHLAKRSISINPSKI